MTLLLYSHDRQCLLRLSSIQTPLRSISNRHLEAELRSTYTQEEKDNFNHQPQVKEWSEKTTFERERAEDNKFEEFRVLESAYRQHTSLYDEVHKKGAERYAALMEGSPSFRRHSRCAQLTQRGYSTTLKNAQKYLREGVVCFAEALGLAVSVEPWSFCVSRNFGDYEQCIEEFQQLETAVAKKMKHLHAITADPAMVEIGQACSQTLSAMKLTPKKDFLASMACVAPKYCPALYRELADCYHKQGSSTKNCRTQVLNVFACTNDFAFRKSERFFVQLDNLKQDEILHPSVAQTIKAQGSPQARPL